MIKYIFLDLDNTILDFSLSEETALKITFSEMNVPASDENVALYSQINDKMWKLLEKGKICRSEMLVRRFSLFYAQLNINADAVKTNKMYMENLSKQGFVVDGAMEMLEKLKEKYALFAASNGNEYVQRGRIEKSGIGKYFEKIFISQEIGYDKPHKEFFEKSFQQIKGFEKDKSIVFGDSLTSDIQGGINAGIKTCWFNPNNKEADKIIPDYTVNKLSDFIGVLSEIQ